MSGDADVGSVRPRPVSVDDLVALNDEIVALARTGLPLERSLRDLGPDLPGRLGSLATALGERMARGESLPEALAASGRGVPTVYRAVVEAGLRSGRLATALEGLATYARGYAEARRSIGLAFVYPLTVLALAYALFVFMAAVVMPRFVASFDSLGIPTHSAIRQVVGLGATARYWGPVLPALLAGLAVVWHLSRRAAGLDPGAPEALLRRLPWLGPMLTGYKAASFADLLALLVEHRVPYHEAIALAGEASGDPALARSGRELAEALRRGLPVGEALRGRSAIPPLLRWLLAAGSRQGDLVAALRQMAGRYRGDARYQAERLRAFLPTFLLLGIGATATVLYALALFLPLTALWNGLAAEAP